VKDCTIADNYLDGDTMPLWGDPDPGTPGHDVYGVYMDISSTCSGCWLRMIHNIVYFNGPKALDDISPADIYASDRKIYVCYSDVQMGAGGGTYPDYVTGGNTNFDLDPRFEKMENDYGNPCNSTMYFLQKASPCVDAGLPGTTDEWGQTHCDLVNTHWKAGCYKSIYYSVHVDGSSDLDRKCDAGVCQPAVGLIDLGYHYDYDGINYIELASFSANVHSDKVVLKWETGTEIDNAGFLVYRCANEASDCIKISDFIAASGDAVGGATYSFTDTNVVPGAGYYYYLVDIDTSGEWTAHGPVFARIPKIIEPILRLPKLEALVR
jgi:hypothetical protein